MTQSIACFPTEKQAIDWVIVNGRDIVTDQEQAHLRSIVLTVIHFDNQGLCGEGDEPAHLHSISGINYPTFAFSKRGYQTLLKEHKYVSRGGESDTLSTWCNYIGAN